MILNYCCQSRLLKLKYQPRQRNLTVLPLYIICKGHDGLFQAPETENNSVESACKRIMLGSMLLQSVIGEKLYEQNMGRKSFQLEDCQVFNSELNYQEARKMDQKKLWSVLGREIVGSGIGSQDRKYLAFLSCTRYCGEKYKESMSTHQEVLQITEAYVALGGGGLALFSTHSLFTWPENLNEIHHRFTDNILIDRSKFLDDSCYRGTNGMCFSTTLGSVLHELCHTFDLGHTENGIMGRGFDNIYKVFLGEELGKGIEISKTHQSNIEFKEKLDSGRLSERLENKPKEYFVKHAFDQADDTFFTKSCSVFLSYHKWFNSLASSQTLVLKYNNTTKFLTSTAGLRVVEIRNEPNEMVLKDWIFDGRILKYSFQLPEDSISEIKDFKLVLVVEDNFGNILKENMN